MNLSLQYTAQALPPLSAITNPGRYQWLSLQLAEPNLGLGEVVGPYNYVLTTSGIGERMWTRSLNLSSTDLNNPGIIRANEGIFGVLSADNIAFDTADISDLIVQTLCAVSEPIFLNKIFTPSITALKANVLDWERRIEIRYLDRSGAQPNQVPIWTGVTWVPGDKVIDSFPGIRLHDFVPLSGYSPGLSADYSFCGVAISGVQVDDAEWRITRLRFSDAGLVDQIGIAYPVRWTDRFVIQYTLLTSSEFYFNTFGGG